MTALTSPPPRAQETAYQVYDSIRHRPNFRLVDFYAWLSARDAETRRAAMEECVEIADNMLGNGPVVAEKIRRAIRAAASVDSRKEGGDAPTGI